MNVSSLHIYPIKSIAADSLDHAICGGRGFEGDRRYMVVNPDGRFLTQRTVPELGLIHFDDGQLTSRGHRPIDVGNPTNQQRKVQIWNTSVGAQAMNPEIDLWISQVIGQPAHLVFMGDSNSRLIDERLFDEAEVSFADGYPYLIANTASLADLNKRITGPEVPMQSFRPNIVVESQEAWAEDHWKTLQIGDAIFDIVSPCKRCKVTTLEPEDPRIRRRDGEPLRTLASFRRHAGGVIFAVNATCRTPGVVIRRGDPCIATS